MTTITKIQEKYDVIEKARTKLVKANTDYLTEVLKIVFANTKSVAFFWQQYTPYFCDGDECIFNVYTSGYLSKDDMKKLTDEDSSRSIPDLIYNSSDLYEYQYNYIENIKQPIILDDNTYNVNYFTSMIDNYLDNTENLLATFGDHVTIIFYLEKNKVKCKLYDYTDHH